MPIYEYKCNDCDGISEILVRGSQLKTLKCSSCGSTEVEKVFSVPGSVGVSSSVESGSCCGMKEGIPPCAGSGRCCQ